LRDRIAQCMWNEKKRLSRRKVKEKGRLQDPWGA